MASKSMNQRVVLETEEELMRLVEILGKPSNFTNVEPLRPEELEPSEVFINRWKLREQ